MNNPLDSTAGGITLLRLHTDEDGVVWAGDDVQLAVATGCDVPKFFTSDVLGVPWNRVQSVRLVGGAINSSLVCHIQQRRAALPTLLKTQRVRLASPVLAAGLSPSAVLQMLWQPGATGSLAGNWHDMTSADFCVHGMIVETARSGEVSEVVLRIVPHHPAWPALSFVPSLDRGLACRLLNEVVDPRWFLHPNHPDRWSRLFAYLGLTIKNMEAVLGCGDRDRHYERAAMTVGAWYNRASGVDTTGPDQFLWRTYSAWESQAKGLLRATQRFVALVATYWVGAVSCTHPEAGFRPACFFHETGEAEAFSRHRARVTKRS